MQKVIKICIFIIFINVRLIAGCSVDDRMTSFSLKVLGGKYEEAFLEIMSGNSLLLGGKEDAIVELARKYEKESSIYGKCLGVKSGKTIYLGDVLRQETLYFIHENGVARVEMQFFKHPELWKIYSINFGTKFTDELLAAARVHELSFEISDKALGVDEKSSRTSRSEDSRSEDVIP
jgi:hypothetical protein